jgi:hypothetical protein
VIESDFRKLPKLLEDRARLAEMEEEKPAQQLSLL